MKLIKLMDNVYINPEYVVSIDAYGVSQFNYKSRVYTAYKHDECNDFYYSMFSPDELAQIIGVK